MNGVPERSERPDRRLRAVTPHQPHRRQTWAVDEVAMHTLVGQLEEILEYHTHQRVAVVVVTLDDFGAVADWYGTSAVHSILQVASARLGRVGRREDLVVRLDGRRFVLVAEGLNDAQEARQIGVRALDVLAEPVSVDGLLLPLRARAGVAVSEPGCDAADLLERAAIASAFDEGVAHGIVRIAASSTRTAPPA